MCHHVSWGRRAPRGDSAQTTFCSTRICTCLGVLAFVISQPGCVTLTKGLSGDLKMQTWDELASQRAPSDPAELAWLADCSEIHLFARASALPHIGEGIIPGYIGGGIGGYIPPEYFEASQRVCDHFKYVFSQQLRRALPDCTVKQFDGWPTDRHRPSTNPDHAAICYLGVSPLLHRDGHMELVETPAMFYPWPEDRLRLIDEANPWSQKSPWRARPGTGAKRDSPFGDLYVYQLSTTGEMDVAWWSVLDVFDLFADTEYTCDLPALEREMCEFADSRARDLARQVEEAIRLRSTPG